MDPLEEEAERVLQDFVDRRAAGERPTPDEVLKRHPHLRELLSHRFATLEALDRLLERKGATPPQDTVLGDFRIVREIGRGGMGVVFQAEQLSLRRVVALKVLGASLTRTWRTIERFRREAGIAARLRHPNIVSVYSVGESQGYYYYAMEFVDGVSLGQVLSRIRAKAPRRLAEVDLASVVRDLMGPPDEEEESGPVSLRHQAWFGSVARLIADLADALVYAHSRGVIHRDVKPQNVLLNRRLVPQLTDFGLAKDMDLETLSQTGDLIGTPQYMSPELVMAGRIRVDHRTDIYSLGVTLYELLTLAVPFTGTSSQEVLRKILFDTPASPRRLQPEVPRDLQVIALRAMEKDPTHRYAQVSELAEDLRRFLRFEPIQTRAPGLLVRMRRFMKRHRARLAIAAGVLLLVLGTGFAVGIREKARRLRDALTAARMHLERGQPHLAGKAYSDLLDTFGEVREARDGLERSGREAETRIHDLVQGATEDETLAREWNGPRAMAVRKLDEALSIRDDPSLRVRRDQAMGIFEVRIVSDPPGATVVLRPCRKATGEWGAGRTMGVTPLTIPIQEGLCRIDLDSPGLGYGEYTFDVGPLPSQRLLEVRIVRTEDALASMVPIPGGRYRLGQERTDLPAGMPRKELPPRMVDLEPFHLDRCEVSNRAYLEFVRQTGHRPAFNWKSGQPPFAEALADKPVTGVDWYDAQAYARWAGKRLPTAAEWEAACRGAGGALFPWGDKFDPDRANFGAPIPLEPGARVEGRPLQPVDGTTPDRTSLGVLHLMGNAQEWVWDPWVSALPGQEHGQWSASATARTVCGWSSLVQAPTEKECSCANRIPREPTDRLPRIGFRCAKSSRP